MAYSPNNPNGQTTKSASAPVTVASDQTAIPVSGTFWQATQPVSLAALPALATGGNVIGSLVANQSVNVSQINGVTPLMGNGVTGTGSPRVTIASDNTANTNPWLIRHAAATTSTGLLYSKVLAAATTNATSVKASAGALYGWHLVNNATTTRYVRIFNLAVAPTMGTSSPVMVIPLPPSGGAVLTPGLLSLPLATGFAYAITAAAADLDNTACAANDVVGTFFYI